MKINKFRVWSSHNNKFESEWDEEVGRVFSGMDGLEAQQFTGKLDINKEEIYEGDIVEYIEKMHDHGDATKCKGIIKYCDTLCAYGAADTLDGDVMAYFFEGVYGHWKVIGNICENPDLVK